MNQSINLRMGSTLLEEKSLLDHPFTALLGGHPQAISLAAPLLEYKSLKRLFYAFCDSNMMDAIDNPLSTQNLNSSLRLSLELSISQMKNTMPEALNLFGFIGLFPGGVSDDEITQMWGNTQWMEMKDALVRASLLVYKTDNKGQFVYSMLPFMSIRAYEYLETNEEKRHSYHMKCCRLFKSYLYNIYQSENTLNLLEELVDMESNIWACIYRSLNRKKNIEYENDDLNSVQSDYFISDQEKSLERLSVKPYALKKRYHENEDRQTTMEKLIEADKESSSDELEESNITKILSKENEATRSIERNYKSHFRRSPKSKDKKSDEEWKESENINEKQKRMMKPKRRARYRKAGDIDQQKKSKFFDEELLVNYYIIVLIMIGKKSDAIKAITEYMQKPGISELGRANLLKSHACILMTKNYNDMYNIVRVIKMFKEAGTLFNAIGCKKGLGICKFALAKLHNEFMPELITIYPNKSDDSFSEISQNFVQNALKNFKQINYNRAEYYAEKLDDHLKKKANIRTFKPTRFYIDLTRKANKQISDFKNNNWINEEIA